MRKVAVVVAAFALLILTVTAAPVMAIGPLKALEVGNNPNLTGNVDNGIAHLDAGGEAGGGNTILWMNPSGLIMHDIKATTGKGKMNNAIIVNITILMDIGANFEEYSNKWIFLSGDDSGPQFMGHGMWYWFAENAFGAGFGAIVVAEHPDGVFITWNYVG